MSYILVGSFVVRVINVVSIYVYEIIWLYCISKYLKLLTVKLHSKGPTSLCCVSMVCVHTLLFFPAFISFCSHSIIVPV